MKQDSTKNHLALAKTNRVSKYTVLCKNYAVHIHECKGSSEKYPIIILAMSSRNESKI